MIRRVQAASGMLFAVFLALHLVNTWLAVAGSATYGAFQRLASALYQASAVEWLVLGAVLVHAGCAVLRWRRAGRGRPSWRARLHRYSGVFLLVVIGGHVAAVRLVPGWFGVRPGFEGVAFSLELLPGYFYPYYWLLAVAGTYHAVNGVTLALARFGLRAPSGRWVCGATVGAAALTGLALLAFGGVLFDVGNPWQSEFAHLYLRFVSG